MQSNCLENCSPWWKKAGGNCPQFGTRRPPCSRCRHMLAHASRWS